MAIQRHKDDFKSKKSALDKAERKALKEKTKAKQKRILTATVVVTIGVLAALKYCNFFGSIVNGIVSIFSATALVPVFKIALPLGISYYTLMSVSYIVDVYRGTIKAEKNYFRLLLFVSYFPHIMEGPFDRYDKLDAQFREPHSLDYDVIKNGALLIMYGLFKKLVIADRAGLIVSGIFDSQSAGGTSIFVGMLVYTLQLYADFSGCIDIVSGTSQMFGINVAENFRQPFFSHSINEFWRRWHITLGLWLKEYVFYLVLQRYLARRKRKIYFLRLVLLFADDARRICKAALRQFLPKSKNQQRVKGVRLVPNCANIYYCQYRHADFSQCNSRRLRRIYRKNVHIV